MTLPPNISRGKIAFFCLIAFASAVCILSAVAGAGLVTQPFRGFPLNEFLRIGQPGVSGFTGSEAGLKLGDNIVEMDGRPVSRVKEVDSRVHAAEIGEAVTYTVQKNGVRRKVAVPTMAFGWANLLIIVGSPFISGLLLLLIGGVVYFLKPDTKVTWIFVLTSFSLALYIIPAFDIQYAHFGFKRFYLMMFAIVPACFIHLSLVFPKPAKSILKYPLIQWLPYLFSAALALGLQVTYTGNLYWTLITTALLYLFISAAAIVIRAIYDFRKAENAVARERARVILMGTSLAFPLPAFLYFLPYAFPAMPNIPGAVLTLPCTIFPAAIAYAIVKHNLFDVDTIIKRTVGYVLLTAILVGCYALSSVGFNYLFGRFDFAQSRFFPIVFTFIIILIFNPLRDRIQHILDRLFYRLEYDYGKTVQQISESMRSLLKLDEIGNAMMATAMDTMFIESGCIVLMNRQSNSYECISADGECFLPDEKSPQPVVPENSGTDANADTGGSRSVNIEDISLSCEDPLIEKIAYRKKEVTIYDIQEDPYFEDRRETYEKTFERLKATLIVPLIYENQIMGLMTLGEKKSGKLYRREDITLLNTLANQGAVALENAHRLEDVIEKERMEEELSIAKDLQISMLPSECPQIDGLEIAAYSASAKEVGGDFYDFIDMGTNQLGFVIGDVTGKSVSGALVMSASRSIFRMLSEEDLSVGEIMTRANRRSKKDIKSGMFVALLYAIVDNRDMTIRMCSAGQTQPVWFSRAAETTRLVETVGDTFPLGILEDVDYEETRIQMAPGDRIVFYTDGIVEAMNPEEEMFGFERLEQIVAEAGTLSAEELMRQILDRVNTFTANAPQHDDITIIVLGI